MAIRAFATLAMLATAVLVAGSDPPSVNVQAIVDRVNLYVLTS
ncbi:hypothetical protein [Nonomuraea typhae]|uniref:Uncharacterized protein n=1 Tax=Nonomuraea typhae TaxID=2603600 RepID=A0ABW7Z2B6_9ACTN